MKSVKSCLEKYKIVPVIVLEDEKKAVDVAKALIDGGLPCAEITFRTKTAQSSIKLITEKFPDMMVGAGTILTTEQVDSAVESGAKFVVSPGLNPKIVEYCIQKKIPIIPGCSNPTDIEMALELGLKLLKFFPAEAAGGTKMIKALSDPYNMVEFMPTGGINQDNILNYLNCNSVLACGGSWMVNKDLIANSEFEKIKELTKSVMKKLSIGE